MVPDVQTAEAVGAVDIQSVVIAPRHMSSDAPPLPPVAYVSAVKPVQQWATQVKRGNGRFAHKIYFKAMPGQTTYVMLAAMCTGRNTSLTQPAPTGSYRLTLLDRSLESVNPRWEEERQMCMEWLRELGTYANQLVATHFPDVHPQMRPLWSPPDDFTSSRHVNLWVRHPVGIAHRPGGQQWVEWRAGFLPDRTVVAPIVQFKGITIKEDCWYLEIEPMNVRYVSAALPEQVLDYSAIGGDLDFTQIAKSPGMAFGAQQ